MKKKKILPKFIKIKLTFIEHKKCSANEGLHKTIDNKKNFCLLFVFLSFIKNRKFIYFIVFIKIEYIVYSQSKLLISISSNTNLPSVKFLSSKPLSWLFLHNI